MDASSGWTGAAEIIARAEIGGGVIGVSAVSPAGERFSHNGGRRFVAASTVKIAIMIELFRQIDAGRFALDGVYRLRPADRVGGSGVVARLHDGIELTLSDLVYLMMSISDNSATNILIDQVGQERVNATMRALAMAGSTLGRRMRGHHSDAPEQENWAVPDDYARVIGALFDGSAASPESCTQMLALLETQQNDRRIARHLPRANGPRWGSKTGSLPGIVNDVGYVMTDRGPFIMAIFCESLTDPNEGERIIGDIARALLGNV